MDIFITKLVSLMVVECGGKTEEIITGLITTGITLTSMTTEMRSGILLELHGVPTEVHMRVMSHFLRPKIEQ